MSTAVPLVEAEQQAVTAVSTLLATRLGENDPPEGGSRQGGYLVEQDEFGPPDATLINAVVSVVRTAKTDVGENPAKLDAWRDAIHGAVQPYPSQGGPR